MPPGESHLPRRPLSRSTSCSALSKHVDLESGEDELTSPEALGDWFAERGLMDAGDPVSAADLRRAIDVREGLRAVLLQNNGHPLDEEQVARLDRAVEPRGGARPLRMTLYNPTNL